MGRGTLFVENFQQSPKIRKKELFEIIGSVFRQENTIRFQLPPMGNDAGEPPLHSREAIPQVFQLLLQRHLQNALENLLVT